MKIVVTSALDKGSAMVLHTSRLDVAYHFDFIE
jgi:hypothetical protein